nr:recombinase RecA [Geobacillus stearothermophilus]
MPCHREVIWWRDSPNGAIEAVPVERRVRGNSHARCGVGEKPEIASKAYLSLSLEIAEALVRSGAVDIIVIDSVAALVPKAEIEGEMGDAHVGLQARLMSQALRKLSGAINKSKTIAIFINQIREKVGVMFGNPETTPGGRALKFYASVRLEVRRAEQIKQGNDMVGNKTKIKVVKNKVAPPFKTADVDIMYGEGISREGEIIDMASELDIVQKSGSWYSYKDERLGQGRENAKQFLKENPHIAEEIARAIRKHYGIDDGEAGGEPMQDEFGLLEE